MTFNGPIKNYQDKNKEVHKNKKEQPEGKYIYIYYNFAEKN